MTNIAPATFARIQHHIDPTLPPGQRSVPGEPDPRTATCFQHRVASPYSDTARGDGITLPPGTDWPCVVCPLPYADLIGTPVISAAYSGIYIYGGEDGMREGFTSLKVGLASGMPTIISCDLNRVAPVDTPVIVNDPRITIEKLPKKRDYQDSGPWLPHVDHPGVDDRNWTAKKTKRDAMSYASRRLAIAEYHAHRAVSAS